MPRIPVEQKHIYTSVTTNVNSIYGTYFDEPVNDCIVYTFPNWPIQGTDENNRIGRKIRTDYITIENYLSLSTNATLSNGILEAYDSYLDYVRTTNNNQDDNINEGGNMDATMNTLQLPISISIREYLIEFERDFFGNDFSPDSIQSKLLDWYRNTYVLTYDGPVMVSNRQRTMRESTDYTGRFRILKDKIHYLDFTKQLIHNVDVIKYERQLNFDNSDDQYNNLPTNSLLIHFYIGPTNIDIDYNNQGFGTYLRGTFLDQVSVAIVRQTLKISYTDV